MKKTLVLLSALLCLTVVPALNAQGPWNSTSTAEITFPFTINNVVYPAGTYTFRVASDNSKVYVSRGPENVAILMIRALDKTTPHGDTHVTFMSDGSHMVLHQIWFEGETHGHDLIHASSPADVR